MVVILVQAWTHARNVKLCINLKEQVVRNVQEILGQMQVPLLAQVNNIFIPQTHSRKGCIEHCLACTDGSSCTKCEGGYRLDDQKKCTQCTAGTYAGEGSTTCKACDPAKWSADGASSCKGNFDSFYFTSHSFFQKIVQLAVPNVQMIRLVRNVKLVMKLMIMEDVIPVVLECIPLQMVPNVRVVPLDNGLMNILQSVTVSNCNLEFN